MSAFFVQFQYGSDANNGLGPDASHATNKPWKTLTKLTGAAGFTSGDTAYAHGIFREVVTAAMTSAVAETKVIADFANAQGFKDGSGNLLASGPVVWTAYLTDDRTAPSGTALLNLSARDFLTFQGFYLVGGINNIITAGAVSTNIKLTDCVLNGALSGPISITGAADTALNWTIDRCYFVRGNNNAISITLPTSASADYDANVLIQNCLFFEGQNNNIIAVASSGANSFKGGGVDVVNCGQFSAGTLLATTSANLSTSIPCTFANCWIRGSGGTGVNANTSGQITDLGGNVIYATTARTNVTAHANSPSANQVAPMYSLGHEAMWGMITRPYGMPLAGSGMLGFSDYASTPAYDALNRARPEGGGSETSAATDTGTATAGAASTLTDAGKSWTVNTFTGYIVKLTGGTGSGQLRAVQSNTATVLTVTVAWTTNPDNTSTYTIDHPAKYYSVGAFERHDTARKGATLGADSGGYLEIVGPGSQDFQIPVDATSTTVSVKVTWNTAHGNTNKPQATLTGGSEIGVSDETKTATGTAGSAYETLTFSAISPSAKGIVTLRLISRATNGNGIVAFDTVIVT